MIEFLRGWIINIVIISILITILEAIIPNNSFKSYIKMVGGFLIIIALINPFINLLTNNINIDKGVFSSIDVNDINYSKEKINSSNEDQIEELYINNMSSAIKSSLESKFSYTVDYINIELLEKGEFKGEIRKVTINLNKKIEKKDKKQNNIVIKKVEIGNKENKDQQIINDKGLKEHLNKEFNIDHKKIYITTD